MIKKTKKQGEREILEYVYGSRALFEVREGERPDFLLRLAEGDDFFGVEVTEFFLSESAARLDHIPGYVRDLLGGGDFRHRVDRQKLEVGEIQIATERGELKFQDVPAIVQRVPAIACCADMVAEVIDGKNKNLASAFASLRHANLIVCDRTGLMAHRKPGDFYSLYYTEALKKALFGSQFREVYFVTKLSAGDVFLPLKMIAFVAQFFFFRAIAESRAALLTVHPVREFMTTFASYLNTVAPGQVSIRLTGNQTEVLYGDVGLLLDAELKLQLRMYSDAPWTIGGGVTQVPDVFSRPEISSSMCKYQRERKFSTGVAFRVSSALYAEE
ncbi:MAG TPA: hypothetical protein VMB18_04870 [Terriglobales bacterium]|nr:hypothetical protein [Terriglobales bacterium]